ncbi:Dabb family protein [bacterium]|nr:Dabb family protein [bacterium]
MQKLMQSVLIVGMLLTVVLGVGFMTSSIARADEQPEKVLRHIVMYKFKDGLPAKEIQEVIDTFCQLPTKIKTIVGFENGTNVSREGKSEGFTHVFVVTFKSEKDRDDYIAHPAHQEYVNVVKNRREKVVVFDYWAER